MDNAESQTLLGTDRTKETEEGGRRDVGGWKRPCQCAGSYVAEGRLFQLRNRASENDSNLYSSLEFKIGLTFLILLQHRGQGHLQS